MAGGRVPPGRRQQGTPPRLWLFVALGIVAAIALLLVPLCMMGCDGPIC